MATKTQATTAFLLLNLLFSPLTNNVAADCLCISIKANLLGLNVSIPGDINLILNSCGKNITILVSRGRLSDFSRGNPPTALFLVLSI
ncbi:unnamed protein product [Spirodela intermedia]|uniref:Hydrophobic seed protein domain-containing protein n=1 Tax=Spirodela intermedia TaxID=51605 RepID=A0ABN7ECM1_SPIIN|nr:unnamed protein product [Spirodela intermedia]